jgi:uncharacterized protein
MRPRHPHTPRLLLALAFGACTRTPNPEEFFASSSAGSGGSSAASVSKGGAGGGNAAGGADGDPGGGEAGEASGGSLGEAGAGGAPAPLGPSCGDAPIDDLPFSKANLRAAAAACADYHYCRFESAAAALESAVQEHADARSDESSTQVRQAFRDAMSKWATVDLFQFGPLSSKAETAAKDIYQGRGIRDLIYSWPLVSRCRAEEQVAGQGYLSAGIDSVLISGRGLYALEYLLFYGGADTACAAATATGKAWPGLSAEELQQRKLDYAVALSSDVLAKIQNLRLIWSPSGENFLESFTSASVYPSEQEAMNALGWSMIYVEKELKDLKLGIRAGYTPGDLVPEVPFAVAAGEGALATDLLRQNLRGFRAIYQGCGPDGEGLGFDDWLVEAGHGELAADITDAWRAAQTATDDFPPLDDASPAELDALYQTVRVLTNLLKTELFSAGSPLGLKLPASVGSDTD